MDIKIPNIIPQDVLDNKAFFIKWATLWHGDHTIDHGEHSGCPVNDILNKPDYTLQELFDAVVETEGGDWRESWDQVMED